MHGLHFEDNRPQLLLVALEKRPEPKNSGLFLGRRIKDILTPSREGLFRDYKV